MHQMGVKTLEIIAWGLCLFVYVDCWLQEALDVATENWGIMVERVEMWEHFYLFDAN